jgi:hypothetical protein
MGGHALSFPRRCATFVHYRFDRRPNGGDEEVP